jgi:hypothetical protein
MPSCRLLLVALLVTGFALVPARARLGETLADLKKRYGRPELESRKDNVFWLFEGDNGQLLYTVTLNAEGRSIAEGLKPHKRARFTEANAVDFIEAQLLPWADSPTLRTHKPGEKYRFAGQEFVCGQLEHVMVDESNGVLLIRTKTVNPAVVVVAPEMFQRGK